jgi:glycosidase
VVSRFGEDQNFRRESAIACAALFTLLRGTPIVYQGDEIAMANFPLESPEQIQDVETRNAYQALLEAGVPPAEAFARVRVQARDNARTPMQWTSGPAAGFSTVRSGAPYTTAPGPAGGTDVPWFPVNPDYREWNVASQRAAADAREPSVLGAYRDLLALRRRHQPLTSGSCTFPGLADLAGRNSPVIVFQRGGRGAGEHIMTIVINFSSSPAPVSVSVSDATGLILPRGRRNAVFATHRDATDAALLPWEVVVVSGT